MLKHRKTRGAVRLGLLKHHKMRGAVRPGSLKHRKIYGAIRLWGSALSNTMRLRRYGETA